MLEYSQDYKFDGEKLRYELIPPKAMESLAEILTYGANKYSDNSWQNVKPFNERYYAAAIRHIQAWRKGEIIDPESGFPHLNHAFCNLMFLICKPIKEDNKNDTI